MAELLHGIRAAGLGELPGEDPREAAQVAVGEMPDLPSLPVLPSLGPWAGGVGRASAFLAELHVDLQPGGWRLVNRPGIDQRRRDSALREQLDGFEEALVNASATAIKTSVHGPWSLAALLERTNLGPVLADQGAVRDLVASLSEGVVAHVRELQRRFERDVVVQIEEPALRLVVEGGIPTTSGLDRIAAVAAPVLQDALATVRTSIETVGGVAMLRQPGERPAVELLRGAGFSALCVDAVGLGVEQEEQLAGLIEGGGTIMTNGFEEVRALWRRLGLDPTLGPASVVLTHEDGVVKHSISQVIAMMKAVRDKAEWLASEPEEWL